MQILNGDFSPAGIARRLLTLPHTPRVTVLLGAGVSTSAGIPDFRSSSGLYNSKAGRTLFSAEALQASPSAFYAMFDELFRPVMVGTALPTTAHAFLRVLKDKGWLQRVFTQNVDGLEFRLLDVEDVVRVWCLSRTPGSYTPRLWLVVEKTASKDALDIILNSDDGMAE